MPSRFNCVWLFPTLWTVAHQARSIHGSLQAGILEWVAISSSRGSSWLWNRTKVAYDSCIAGRFSTAELPGKPWHGLNWVYTTCHWMGWSKHPCRSSINSNYLDFPESYHFTLTSHNLNDIADNVSCGNPASSVFWLPLTCHIWFSLYNRFPRWHSGKESTCQCRRHKFNPWVRKILWRRKW